MGPADRGPSRGTEEEFSVVLKPLILALMLAGNHRGELSQAFFPLDHRIHGAAIYGNMDPINIAQSC